MEEVPGQPVAPQNQENNRNPDGTFKEGISGNPGGRPKGSYSVMTLIRKMMEEVPPGQVKQWRQQVAEKILEKAIVEGNEKMLTLITNYMDGMPNQKIDVGVDTDDMGGLTEFFRGLAATGNASKKKAVKKDDDNSTDGTGTE